MLALLVATFTSAGWVPPDRPGTNTLIGSPAYRHLADSWVQAVSPDGTRIYTATFWACSYGSGIGGVFVWDARTGKRLAVSTDDERLMVWDVTKLEGK